MVQDVPTPEQLLAEVRAAGLQNSSYSQLHDAVAETMRRYHAIPSQVSARDVLIYARDHGLIVRRNGELIILPAEHETVLA